VPFTACDRDGLPVAHLLPSTADQRTFSASLTYLNSSAATSRLLAARISDIEVVGQMYGVYLVIIAPSLLPFLGEYSISLTLDGEPFGGGAFRFSTSCGSGRVPHGPGMLTCACPAAQEPLGESQGCEACTAGKYKPDVGNEACEDKPFEFWPFVVVGVVLVVATLLASALYSVAEHRRRTRETSLRRDFLAITYHEIRNPLNGAVGWLRELQHTEDLPETEVRAGAASALECTDVALNFLNSLSMLLKLDAKQFTVKLAATDLGLIMDRIATVVRPQLASGVQFHVETEPIREVLCDASLLTHVLLNICQNAARFTTAGSVRLICKAQPVEPSARGVPSTRRLFFAVRDTGKGIGKSAKAELFTRYSSDGGIGIGLFLSRQLVMLLGSDIEVVSPWSESGATGTSFQFILTLKTMDARRPVGAGYLSSAENSPMQLEGPDVVVAYSTDHGMVSLKPSVELPRGIQVLVADDHPTNRELFRHAFVRFGWDVETAQTAEEVLERVLRDGRTYDILVCDEHFGPSNAMRGSAAIQSLRSGGFVGVIVTCSGFADDGARQAMLASGADVVWSKPFPDWRDGSMQRDLAPHLTRLKGVTRDTTDTEEPVKEGKVVSLAEVELKDFGGDKVPAPSLQRPVVLGAANLGADPKSDSVASSILDSASSPDLGSSSSTHAPTCKLSVDASGYSVAPMVTPLNHGLPPGLSVLVADDMRMNRMILRKIFSTHFKWTVIEASSPEEALELALGQGNQHDVIFVDEHFNNSTMVGSEVIRELRGKLSGKEVIISCTGNHDSKMVEVLGNSVDAVWGKPYPDHRDGTMQAQLVTLLAKKRGNQSMSHGLG